MFQELDRIEAEEGQKRSSMSNKKNRLATKPAKKPPQPRKNTKKANVEPENDNSSMEIGKPELFYNLININIMCNLLNFDINSSMNCLNLHHQRMLLKL